MNRRTIYDTDHTTPLKEGHNFDIGHQAPPNIVDQARNILPQLEGKTLEIPPITIKTMDIDPQQLLIDMLDHIHDGNREELIGQLILMLGWLHKGGEMPYIHKDSDTVWVVPTEE